MTCLLFVARLHIFLRILCCFTQLLLQVPVILHCLPDPISLRTSFFLEHLCPHDLEVGFIMYFLPLISVLLAWRTGQDEEGEITFILLVVGEVDRTLCSVRPIVLVVRVAVGRTGENLQDETDICKGGETGHKGGLRSSGTKGPRMLLGLRGHGLDL